MPTVEEELNRFVEFVRERLANGGVVLTLDELFDLWRSENPTDELYAENVSAVKAALEDFVQGDRGTLAGENSDQLRRQFGIKPQ